jgi:hypothetical protein
MEHIDQNILERFVLEDPEIIKQRSEIEIHLKECAGCASLYKEMIEYYSAVQTLNEEQTAMQEQALTLRTMIMRIPGVKLNESRSIPATLPARIVLFVIRHYLVTSFGALTVLGALLFLLYSGKQIKNDNPAYARAKNEFLVVMNNDGQEIWRKHIGIGYDEKSTLGSDFDAYLATADIDGNGKNEVMGIFGFMSSYSSLSNVVSCFNADGTQRWKSEFHRQLTFNKREIYDDYLFIRMVLGQFGDDRKLRIAAIARHHLY